MVYYAYEEDRLKDYLMHHGVNGMHWGVWNEETARRYLGGSKVIAQRTNESMSSGNSKNLDKWGTDPNHNVLYICGKSGSGKTTLAMNLKNKEHANHIGLDAYFEKDLNTADKRTLQDQEFNSFLIRHGIDYQKMAVDAVNRQNRDWGLVDSFANAIEPFAAEQYRKGRKVVVEGVALNDETLFADRDKSLKGKPFIELQTPENVAKARAEARDSKR